MTDLSIIVTMGYVNQKQVEHKERGDEIDHISLVAGASSDFEIIIVDRAWPTRWKKASVVLSPLIDRNILSYIPPKPSEHISHGYRACSAMRNSGGIIAKGKIVAFVDDHLLLDPVSTDEVCNHFQKTQRILCPVCSDEIDSRTPGGAPSDFSGHNGGIYMCSREDFITLNGCDENFDGAYGEADTEFEDRIDRQLYLHDGRYRQRKNGVKWLKSFHGNGKFPEKKIPFWKGPEDKNYLRCNRAYAHSVCYPRIRKNIVKGNTVPTDAEMDALRGHNCTDGKCKLCNRGDREEQINSYRTIKIDSDIASMIDRFGAMEFRGCQNPWEKND